MEERVNKNLNRSFDVINDRQNEIELKEKSILVELKKL